MELTCPNATAAGAKNALRGHLPIALVRGDIHWDDLDFKVDDVHGSSKKHEVAFGMPGAQIFLCTSR